MFCLGNHQCNVPCAREGVPYLMPCHPSLTRRYPPPHLYTFCYCSAYTDENTQLLHCLEFDGEVKGGASTLLDAFAAAEHFRDNFPDKFEVCGVSVCPVFRSFGISSAHLGLFVFRELKVCGHTQCRVLLLYIYFWETHIPLFSPLST